MLTNEAADRRPAYRVCHDRHTFRPVKDYTTREVRNPRWEQSRDYHPGMAGAFAPLKEICPDRATPEFDGTDGTAGKNDVVPAGSDGAGRIPARGADRNACHRA